MQQNRESTYKNYRCIWRQFNKFIISLDVMPKLWEDRTTLFIGYLIDKDFQSSTIKSYVSAIERTLVDDKYQWNDSKVLLTSLTKACKLKNDCVTTRLPIYCSLLELILFKVERIFRASNQPYLESLYKALFGLGYYGLMRVGELTESPHSIKAINVRVGVNKDKILIILYSSKTHDESNRPQKIKITSNRQERSGFYKARNFCPFALMRNYIKKRGPFVNEDEIFFVFGDKKPVTGDRARKLLKRIIQTLGLEPCFYDMHSFRMDRTSDLIKYNYSIEEVKRMGRWRSNVIYKYIRAW